MQGEAQTDGDRIMDFLSSMRRTFALGVALLFALALIISVMPSSQGADVTVFPMNPDTMELEGDSDITSSYVIFNNGTSPFLVKGSVTPS
jgi:hypothetical protein